jgi:hypothetical protein
MVSLWSLSLLLAACYGAAILALGGMVIRRVGSSGEGARTVLSAILYGVLILACLGAVIAAWPGDKRIFAFIVALVAAAAVASEIRFVAWYVTFLKSASGPLVVWGLSTLVALTVSFAPARQPPTLFDGPYVFKRWVLPVQIQSLTGHLPADNSLPAVVTEYLARGIKFADVRPIMPGQEVSNRPILVGLAAVPARVLLGGSIEKPDPMPRFDYVSTSWPDTLSLVSDFDFRLFLALGITLNALVAVAFYVLLSHFNVRRKIVLTVIFCSLSPYVILHTIFTWPKNLAGFFIIASLILLFCGPRRPVAAGVALGLAYWAHPLALAFIGVFTCYAAWTMFFMRQWGEQARHYAITGALAWSAVALWMVLSQAVMQIPADLIVQNQRTDLDLVNIVWVRLKNLYTTLAPLALDVFPFEVRSVISRHLITIWAPLGLLIFFMGLGYKTAEGQALRQVTIFAGVAGMGLILVFGTPTVPLLHGWQAVWPVLAVAPLVWLGGERSRGYLLEAVAGAQLIINIVFLRLWASVYSTL